MIRTRTFTAGLVVAGLLATGLTAFAQGPRGERGMRGPIGGPGVAFRGLNLTDAQREQVRTIRERYREQTQASVRQLADARQKQRQAIGAIPVDEALITSLTQDLAQAEVEVALQQARINNEIWSVLTPEQQAQATKARAERQARQEQRQKQMEERRQQREQRRQPR